MEHTLPAVDEETSSVFLYQTSVLLRNYLLYLSESKYSLTPSDNSIGMEKILQRETSELEFQMHSLIWFCPEAQQELVKSKVHIVNESNEFKNFLQVNNSCETDVKLGYHALLSKLYFF